MKNLFIYILISLIISTICFSCVGYGVSYGAGVGFGGATGPYGYGSYPRVNVGVYGGGYPRPRY
jgi:hypothetical protein